MLLELCDIHKSFGTVAVLRGIDLCLDRGEVLALLGENGAGKSTLMNIISGVYSDYQGQLKLHGEVQHYPGPADAERAGIALVHQELTLIGELTVAQNIVLGHEPLTPWGTVDRQRMREIAGEQLRLLGVDLDLDQPVKELRLAAQQVVEIARALSRRARVLLLDEPTAALTSAESDRLFKLVDQLAASGVAVVYISHRFNELFRIAQRAVVLRNGQLVLDAPIGELNEAQLVAAMVGREDGHLYERQSHCREATLLRVQDLQLPGASEPLSFSLAGGEILGFTGLLGCGAGELLECLYGLHGGTNGRVELDGQAIQPDSPQAALAAGLALVTEDRKRDGLVLTQGANFNLELPQLPARSNCWMPARLAGVEALLQRLSVKCAHSDQPVEELSGGNQQKLVLGRCLPLAPRVVLLVEPTRGVDVAAKAQIYRLLDELTEAGIALLLATTDAAELITLCDRIAVMRSGSISGILPREAFSPTAILELSQFHEEAA